LAPILSMASPTRKFPACSSSPARRFRSGRHRAEAAVNTVLMFACVMAPLHSELPQSGRAGH
jgi:hypothetical protein